MATNSANSQSHQPRFLGYGLPRAEGDTQSYTFSNESFELTDVPLQSDVSFLDYDGVVVTAGAFERVKRSGSFVHSDEHMICIAP